MRDLLRDEELLSQVLRRRLLRSIIRAVGVLNASGRGRAVGLEDLRAAAALVRMAPRVMLPPPKKNEFLMSTKMWTVEAQIGMEVLGEFESREEAARRWRHVFDMNGPREGLFETREQAADYGRNRFDHYEQHRAEMNRRFEAGERDWQRVY
jgi:hypothetical protein